MSLSNESNEMNLDNKVWELVDGTKIASIIAAREKAIVFKYFKEKKPDEYNIDVLNSDVPPWVAKKLGLGVFEKDMNAYKKQYYAKPLCKKKKLKHGKDNTCDGKDCKISKYVLAKLLKDNKAYLGFSNSSENECFIDYINMLIFLCKIYVKITFFLVTICVIYNINATNRVGNIFNINSKITIYKQILEKNSDQNNKTLSVRQTTEENSDHTDVINKITDSVKDIGNILYSTAMSFVDKIIETVNEEINEIRADFNNKCSYDGVFEGAVCFIIRIINIVTNIAKAIFNGVVWLIENIGTIFTIIKYVIKYSWPVLIILVVLIILKDIYEFFVIYWKIIKLIFMMLWKIIKCIFSNLFCCCNKETNNN